MCALCTFVWLVVRPLMNSQLRRDVSGAVGVGAPFPEPRTETRTHLGIQRPVYTRHPSAGGAARARPFPPLGSGSYPISYLCGACWPGQRREAGLVGTADPEVELG